MSIRTAQAGLKSVSLHAKVIRANGTVEDLGVVAFHHRNPLRRLAWRVTRLIKRLRARI